MRPVPSNPGKKYIKIFQDYFANIRPQENNIYGGEFTKTYMYAKSRKKYSIIIWRGMTLYMILKGWEPGFKSVKMVL